MNKLRKQQLLQEIRQTLSQILGSDLDQILLYGSQARGDTHSDSDVDILLVMKGEIDYAHLLRQTSEAIAKLSLENDVVISRAFISNDRFLHERSPFILNVKREAVSL
jgi:uncharacterized protein